MKSNQLDKEIDGQLIIIITRGILKSLNVGPTKKWDINMVYLLIPFYLLIFY